MLGQKPTYLDLFAGGGGLSEGFTRAGFEAVAHIEMDQAACFTLKTRQAFRYLMERQKDDIYHSYLRGEISRTELYSLIPEDVLEKVLNYEISQATLSNIFEEVDRILGNRSIDFIVGGPPCQAYSLIGRARSEDGMRGDKRNYLYRMYSRFLKRYQPRFFVFENVTGLLSAKNNSGSLYLDVMRRSFRKCGYDTSYRILDAGDYGVPQSRKRVIIIGKLLSPGEKANGNWWLDIPKCSLSSCTINELFEDLPVLQAGKGTGYEVPTVSRGCSYLYDSGIKIMSDGGVSLHMARSHNKNDLEIYRRAVKMWNKNEGRLKYDELPSKLQTHSNVSSFLDRYKVVEGNRCLAHTVVAHISQDGHYYIHPDLKQNRSLTPREAARLQTFPDDYYFESCDGVPQLRTAFRQIGNAVPVRLAECIANAMKEL